VAMDINVGIIGWVIAHNESVITNDASRDPRFFPWVDRLTGFVTSSILCVPIRINGNSVGAFEIINSRSGGFTNKDKELLEGFSIIISERMERFLNKRSSKYDADFLTGIIDTINEGIIILNRDLRIRFANQSFAMFLNTDKEKIINKSLHEIFHHTEIDCIMNICKLCIPNTICWRGIYS